MTREASEIVKDLRGPYDQRQSRRVALEYEAADTIERLRKALERLVNAKALIGVRGMVAGWNGEGKPDGPYERHPPRLGATIPKSDCGSIYELDEAMCAARQALDPRP